MGQRHRQCTGTLPGAAAAAPLRTRTWNFWGVAAEYPNWVTIKEAALCSKNLASTSRLISLFSVPSHIALSWHIWILMWILHLSHPLWGCQGGHFPSAQLGVFFLFGTVLAILQSSQLKENSACLLWVLCERKLCGLDFYVRIPEEGKMLQITSINHFKQSSGNAIMI